MPVNPLSGDAPDKPLFTPGPLTTSRTVKEAMLHDVGSRDDVFIQTTKAIRNQLLEIGQVPNHGYEAILLQGSGTFGLEAVLASTTPPNGKWLIVINGAYGKRLQQIAQVLKLESVPLIFPENGPPEVAEVEAILQEDSTITHVAVVHCETTTGIINPVNTIGQAAKAAGKIFFVDAMSSFGAIPLHLADLQIDYLVSSANKCIQGVPGFCFILARREALLATKGYARSVSLDLLAQWQGLETNGQFRFTPPTHTLLAFQQALIELQVEGGVTGRATRYRHNYKTLIAGMRHLGFKTYLPPEHQSYIITAFYNPTHPNFDFAQFYQRLNKKGFVIYPGKVSDAACFRIGTIGHIFEDDIQNLLVTIQNTLSEMNVTLSTS